MEGELSEAVADFRQALKSTDEFITKGTGLIHNADDQIFILQRHLRSSLRNLDRASENFNRFMEVVADNPALLLFGEPPHPRKVEKEE